MTDAGSVKKTVPPRRYYFHDRLSVDLLEELHTYYWLELCEKKLEDGSWSNLDLIEF